MAATTASEIRPGPQASPATRGLVYFVAWTLVALATTELQYFAQPQVGAQPYGRLVRLALASCWLWALFTPAVLALARRVRIDR